MGQVKVSVNGQRYQLACRDGEEDRLIDLARYVDEKVKDLAETMGSVGDSRLLLLAALVVADELHELRENTEGVAGRPETGNGMSFGLDAGTANRLDALVDEIEDIAARLENA